MTANNENKIILDLEIQDPILKQSDWDETEKIRMSCCVIYDYLIDRYRVYDTQDMDALRARIIAADLVIGFNSNKFDLPVIYGLPARQFPTGIRSYDILHEIWKTLGLDVTQFSELHKGYGLNALCKATLGKHKTGSGENAPLLWQLGEYCKVIDYCINDVALTKELYDFIEENGFVKTRKRNATETVILNMEKYADYLAVISMQE